VSDQFKIEWIDSGREPRCPPNPAYPNGIDLDFFKRAGEVTCHVDLPYPAKRCGHYLVSCGICKARIAITTAGRPDDPRSVEVECKLKGSRQ
jgi:hypothetical protein